jgi:hypothetical protein
MIRFSILLFLTTILIYSSFSQGEFIQRGNNGFGGGAGFSTNSEMNGITFFAGYSYKGFLDANLTYWKVNGGKVQDGVLSPSVTYYLVKQEDSEKAPTLGVSIGFSRYTSKTVTKTEIPDTVGIQWRWYEHTEEKKVNAIKLGVNACHRIGYWKAFFFQPSISAGVSMISTGWEFIVHGSVAVGSRVMNGPLLILTPGIERQSGVTTFILTFSVIS